ncbi:MAG: zinc metallopeptidase [Clostridiales bacterium]|nr:zinc metallopeptidase [Clostridiales bacterium]
MFYFDWTIIIIIPAIILALYAQMKLSSTFSKYSRVASATGMTGAQVAAKILNAAGIHDVRIEHIRGHLTDHYDPSSKILRLSDDVYSSVSVAAAGVAAHETGHAIQHKVGYSPLGLRSAIVPVVNFGSNLAWPLVIIGLLFTQAAPHISQIFVNIGVIGFGMVVVFSLVTLPVEFNASARAVSILSGFLSAKETKMVKQVLSAAAMTYVAAAANAVLQLIRILIITGRRRD